ncbi:hypothetical protein BSLG_001717 [Batrachochytrium salamandrivorans]|nr:hypothetical protein BASA81_012393 [Batrachochytrium salamandrivorans]KAJ1343736.1 hypothetical protein BSLG_001717 [Batrachochytrium salamandrivorans]
MKGTIRGRSRDSTLGHLLSAAQCLFTTSPALSRHLVTTFLDHTVAGNVSVSPAVRRKLCTSCGSLLIPGLTSKVTTVSVRASRSSALQKTQHHHRYRGQTHPPLLSSQPPQSESVHVVSGSGLVAVGASDPTPATETTASNSNIHLDRHWPCADPLPRIDSDTTRAPYRIAPQPITQTPCGPHGDLPKKLATNIRRVCLVCNYASYLPGTTLSDLSLLDQAAPLVRVPEFDHPLPKPAHRRDTKYKRKQRPLSETALDATLPSRSLSDPPKPNTKKTSPISSMSASGSTATASQDRPLKAGKRVSAKMLQPTLPKADQAQKKKKDKRRNELQSLIKKQQQTDKDPAKHTYSLADFLADV